MTIWRGPVANSVSLILERNSIVYAYKGKDNKMLCAGRARAASALRICSNRTFVMRVVILQLKKTFVPAG